MYADYRDLSSVSVRYEVKSETMDMDISYCRWFNHVWTDSLTSKMNIALSQVVGLIYKITEP